MKMLKRITVLALVALSGVAITNAQTQRSWRLEVDAETRRGVVEIDRTYRSNGRSDVGGLAGSGWVCELDVDGRDAEVACTQNGRRSVMTVYAGRAGAGMGELELIGPGYEISIALTYGP